jgi:hypothetical protein
MIQRALFTQKAIERAADRKRVKVYGDTDKHDASNRIAANAILEDTERYGGESAALVRWSRAFLARVAK